MSNLNNNLNNNFTLWYHNPNNSNWTEDSYHQILSFNNLEEFWVLDNLINKNLIENGMFFVMKEDIVPIWENDKNKEGGYISWKISRENTYDSWIDIIGHILINNLFSSNSNNTETDVSEMDVSEINNSDANNSQINSNNLNNLINGCSISPKKKFNILKIWLNKPIDTEKDTIIFNNTFKLKEEPFTFKLHQVNIEKDKKNNTKK